MKKPLILVVNDDGITSRGILSLINVVKELGDVLVVAPDGPQSGMGHAITVGNTMRLTESSLFEGVRAFECSGTPADCVKIARHFVLKDSKQPDIVVRELIMEVILLLVYFIPALCRQPLKAR